MIKYLIIFLFIISFAGCNQTEIDDGDNDISLSKAMGDVEEENFTKAIDKIEFVFPKDHGPHPDFRTEWWYFTGNLTDKSNRKFGYQFTIFRTALTKKKEIRNSDWSSNQIYMAHFAVTDIENDEFYFEERFSREANKLAGAQIDPLNVWLEDWQVIQIGDNIKFDLPTISISAKTGQVQIDFTLTASKPKVLQGEDGLSQKGKQPGNASYYYSYTRLNTEGKIILNEQELEVLGYSWMDREWSTSALSDDQVGWDWFAFQFNDNSEIMYYQMRKKDGTPDKYSKGIIVDKKGSSKLIKNEEVNLEVTDYWESPSGIRYPSGWKLDIPNESIKLEITPAIKKQLMDVSINYWEGAVLIEGLKNNEKLNGRGYVELTGYY
ncbi:MAG: carotenoid 1,2-hydratase [Ignavibacteriaceae bacterium]|nr:carotenoid 1,2-hydratase [Ignavibacteriaceae bacterium]